MNVKVTIRGCAVTYGQVSSCMFPYAPVCSFITLYSGRVVIHFSGKSNSFLPTVATSHHLE